MSWVAAAYVKKLRVDMDGKKLTKGHKLILFVLADYHNEERGDAWTSLRHMAIESLHSRTGLIRSLGELEKGGVIRVLRHHDAVKNRIINRYVFPALDSIASAVTTPDLVAPVHHPSRASTPPLVAPVHHPQSRQYTTPSRASTPPLVAPVHHIFPKNLFPKNLYKESIQIQEKSVAKGLPVDNCDEQEEKSKRFNQFTSAYPHRGGKRLEQASTKALFCRLSPADQSLVLTAAGHYAAGLKDQGLLAKDQKRFLLDPSGHEPWRDWIEPASLAVKERPPPMPPKIDPIARGLWRRTYGDPKEHGYQ